MRFFLLILFGAITISCAQPKEFSIEALDDIFMDTTYTDITFRSILEKHQGKTIFIDIWASWCTGQTLLNF